MPRLKIAALVLAAGEAVSLLASTSALAQTTPQLAGTGSPPIEKSPPNKSGDASPAAPVSSNSDGKPPAGPTGGYSWRSKPASHKAHQHRQKVDPLRPQAKGPEFAVASDGTSHISVQLSQRVEVSTSARANTHTYDLPNAQVAVPNDRNPLVTTHFTTPVSKVKLIPHGKSAQLIVELREPSTPQFQVRQLPNGGAVLEISLAKPTGAVTNSSGAVKRKPPPHKVRPRG